MTDHQSGMPRRPRGTGALFLDARGYWTATVELVSSDGKRRRKVVRSRDEAFARAAVAAMSEQIGSDREARRLAFLRESVAATDLPWTVESWSAHWLETIARRRVKPKTFEAYESAVRLHIVPAIGSVPLETLSPSHLRAVETSVLDLGRSPSSALHTHRVMAVCFGDAVREEVLERNPAERMHPPRKAASKLSTLTANEAASAFRGLVSRPDGALWATLLFTGARRGEILGLELDRVGESLELSWQLQRFPWKHGCAGATACPSGWRAGACPQRHVTLPATFEHRHVYGSLYLTRPKSSAGVRYVPLIEPLRSVLLRHIRTNPIPRNGLVFVNSVGNPIDPDWASRRWIDLRKELGITKPIRLHDLRHAAVDMLYEAGVPEDLITELIGHSSSQMTRGYKSSSSQERRRAAVESMAALYR
ncbi:hypothetical protein C1I63_13815 [Rathayibacter caricis DSM 15933]|uniref:Site-specific integrase n=1 Tax=Rathayibacter caricis DSM 15933 TaxID=1328867 RepID=A0A2T4UW98_9MICO|nr:site-specific integrase [Rathayibacter caricis]PTL73806.1 hypothetical protein C1I63_13815 [Rathayibacter caricis DSM 15933]